LLLFLCLLEVDVMMMVVVARREGGGLYIQARRGHQSGANGFKDGVKWAS
jgi:hypothetical protein